MALTPKQEQFAQHVASGKSQSAAYRAAYDVGEDTKPEIVWNEASLLMKSHEVSVRVEELKAELAKRYLWTREDSVKTLVDKVIDVDGVKEADIINAVKELNAMHGYKEPENVNVNTTITSIARKVVDPKDGDNGA